MSKKYKPVIAIESMSVDHGNGYPKIHIDAVMLYGDHADLSIMDPKRIAAAIELAITSDGEPAPKQDTPRHHEPCDDWQRPEYIDSGIYKGCEWCISKCHDHLCAYVCVEGLGLHYESTEDCRLDVHGGCSWVGGIEHVPGMRSNGMQWVGWDYNHYGDKPEDFDAKRVKDEVYGVIDEAIVRYRNV